MSNIHSGYSNTNAIHVPMIEPVLATRTAVAQPPTPLPMIHPISEDEKTYEYKPLKSLERCFTCKKCFAEKETIYMYRGLAFCSDSRFTRNKNCRNQVMDRDFEEEKKRQAMSTAMRQQ